MEALRPPHPRAPRAWLRLTVALVALAAGTVATERLSDGDDARLPYTHFEVEPVRPIALSEDGRFLYVLNNADDYLEVYETSGDALVRIGETPVGMRPVAIALAGDQAWITNHLSDSVSVVDVTEPSSPRVTHTLRVGDEPRDIVVAGTEHELVVVATANRENLTEPGVGRGALWIFERGDPASPPRVVLTPGMKLRGLAAEPDGSRVYASVFRSGNGTTLVAEPDVTLGGGGPAPNPTQSVSERPPNTGLIVVQHGPLWVDEAGRDWAGAVGYSLPDEDVFILRTDADAPRLDGAVRAVGATLFNLAVQPRSGDLWVSSTDARNGIRFEPNLKGNVAPSLITIVDASTRAPSTVELNSHIDRAVPGTAVERSLSLAQPLQFVFSSDGDRAYVPAFLSGKVAELDGSGTVLRRFEVGFGPGGVALDESRNRLYVLNFLDTSVSTIDLVRSLVSVQQLHHDPLPEEVRAGRPFLYDAELTSAHGDMSCASCHVFADNDGLAWDLGDPGGEILPIPFNLTHPNLLLKPAKFEFHPMKGPMVTQSFRGMAGAGPMHWRGDRFSVEDPDDELASFRKFNPAFVSLNGREDELDPADMDAFGEFLLSIHYPPNPVQNLDRSRTPDQQAGFDVFTGDRRVDSGVVNCAGCHALPLGTNGRVNFEGNNATQDFKAPHLRALYEKVGRFDEQDHQPTGFGFTHDGASDTLFTFLHEDVFDFGGATEAEDNRTRSHIEAYLLAFDSGMAPIVGHGPTIAGTASPTDLDQLDLIVRRATAGDCDLVAHAPADGHVRGWLLEQGAFRADTATEPAASLDDLLNMAESPSSPVSFVCVPPGNGLRSALDRDSDGHLNGDERDAGSDPGDASSIPGAPTPTPTSSQTPAASDVLLFLPAVRR